MHKKELPEVDPVELRSLFGLRPGIIILILLILAFLLCFFLLFVLPGLMSKGSYVRFSLNTRDTAIYMDGSYLGSSEGSVYYLPHGGHEFSFSIAGEDAGSVSLSVPHPVFFTLIHRRVTDVSYDIQGSKELEKAVTESFSEEVPLWARTYEWDSVNHLPPLFSSFAHNAKALGFEDVSQALSDAALDISSPELYQDFLIALGTLEASDVTYLSPSLEALLPVLEGLYGNGEKKTVMGSEKPVVTAETLDGFYRYAPLTLTIGKSGDYSFPDIIDSPVTVETGEFCIAARPVSEYEYALFVADNPYWASSNAAQLAEDGVADENYLKGVALSTAVKSTRPVRCVSYYAAEAYVEWLSGKTGIDYMLPTEAEWTVAALSASSKPYVKSLSYVDTDTSSPQFMSGGVWEMTSTPFHALSRAADYDKAVSVPSPDVIVKGGSYINEDVDMDTVGVMAKSATSPYAGFRIGVR